MNRLIAGAALALVLGGCGAESSKGSPTPVATGAPAPAPAPSPTPTSKPFTPNVVMIVVDDLNTYIEGYEGHPQAVTPNIRRLVERGVTFTSAQANGSICAPSRASFLTGYLPATSGKHFSNMDFREIPLLSDAKLLPEHFRDNGFAVYGAGKIFHDQEEDNRVFGSSDVATHPTSRFDRSGGYVGPKSSFGPYPWDGLTKEWNQPSRHIPLGNQGQHWEFGSNGGIRLLPGGRWNNNPDLPTTIQKWSAGFGRISQLPTFRDTMNSTYPAGWTYKGWADFDRSKLFETDGPQRTELADEQIGDWTAALLSGQSASFDRVEPAAAIDGRQFFLMVGLTKTHPALYVPDEYYDAVIAANGIKSVADVALPLSMQGSLENGDLDDIPASLFPRYHAQEYQNIMLGGREGGVIPDVVNPGKFIPNSRSNLLRSMILSYLAAVYTVDVQVGKILDAIDANPELRDNTIILFTSDQGTHLGEKMSFNKGTLWKETFNVPLILVDPREQYDSTRGQATKVPVSLVDLFPTLSELAGLPAPAPVSGKPPLDGQSFVAALSNTANPTFAREALAISSTYAGNLDSVIRNPANHHYSMRTERYRYILSKTGEEELYDRDVDQHEHNNLAGDPRYDDVKASLKAKVRERIGL